jgi:hypothetical protein
MANKAVGDFSVPATGGRAFRLPDVEAKLLVPGDAREVLDFVEAS